MNERLLAALADLDPVAGPAAWFDELVRAGVDDLPLPASGSTLERWRSLAAVAHHDLSLAKLFEGHTDAIAILRELGCRDAVQPGHTWATWAAEAPGSRVIVESQPDGRAVLHGTKYWCSGAEHVSHGLLTAWHEDGRGPQLVGVDMRQARIEVSGEAWRAVGMAASASFDVTFDGAVAQLVGDVGDYLSRPGFWQGGAGIAACWFGGASAVADALRAALHSGMVSAADPPHPPNPYKLASLGKVDVALASVAALLREAAGWVDLHPRVDASAVAFRTRLAAEQACACVLAEVGRSVGAGPFCRDARFARLAADLPVFVRQSHGESDFAALGERSLASSLAWTL